MTRPTTPTQPSVDPTLALPAERRGNDRRRLTLRTFLQSGFTPRRRGGRRAGEYPMAVDWHEPHLLFLSVTILLLSVVDAFLTLMLINEFGVATEANPFLAFVLDAHPKAFAVAKLALTALPVIVLVAMARFTVFRLVRVVTVLHWVLLAYIALIAYEWWLYRTLV